MSKAMRSQILFWTLLILLVVLFILWQWGPVHSFAWKYDEGINVSKAQLLLDRHHLYEDIWSDQPPLFTFMLATTFLLFGESVAVGRLMVLALAGLALLSLAWIAEQVAGKVAALLAAVALALFPHFQELSQLIMIGLPAISLGLLALAFGFRYRAKGRMRWLLFAGLSFGLSLLVKPITAPMFLPLSILSLGTGKKNLPLRKRIRPWAFFAAATLLPVFIVLICCSPRAFVQQVAGTLFDARRAHNLSLIENVRQIGIYLSRDKWELSHARLSMLALLGMASLALHRRWYELAILGTWLGSVLGAVALHTPLRRHQLFLVVPPILTTASLSVQEMVEVIPDIVDRPLKEQLLMAIIAAALLHIGRSLPQTVTADIAIRETLLAEDDESRAGREAIRFLLAHTPAQSHVITDDPMLTFKADRPIPPSLAVPSARRIETQELSSKEMIRLTKDVDPSAILFWEQRLTRLEEYATWVRENFYTAHAYADDRWIHTPQSAMPITFPQPASTQEGIRILGSDMASLAVEPGSDLMTTIFLRTEKHLASDFTLFVHLLDEEGNVWGQEDIPPLDRHYPSSAWRVGEIIAQSVRIAVGRGTPPGEKILSVGLYDSNGDRLLLYDGQANPLQSKQIILTPRPVVRWQPNYTLPAMEHRQQAILGDHVELSGYDGPALGGTTDKTLEITLYWRCLQTIDTSYMAFVHLLDEKGNLITQRDQIPGQGAYPTSGWLPGEVISDTYTIPLPTDLASGTYQLAVGLYDPSTVTRLPVRENGKPNSEKRILLHRDIIYES